MARYINKFDTVSALTENQFTLDYPNINYIVSGDVVVWNETMPRYKFLLTDTSGNKNGIAWDSANTEVTRTELNNIVSNSTYIHELTVDSGVTKIGDYFLLDCNQYIVTNIMSGVTEIGNQGFKPNQGYTDMSKLPNVTKLNQESVKLQSFYDIPSGVTSIGTNSVAIADTSTDYTSGLTISSNISEILGRPLGNAFVSRYIFESTTPPSISNLSNIFVNYGGYGMDVFVPDSSVTDYKNSFSGYSSNIFSINDMPTSGFSLMITDFDDNIVFEVPQILNSNNSETLSSFYLPNSSIIGNNKKTLQIGEGITGMSSTFIYGDWYHKLSDTVFDDVILPSTIKYFSGYNDSSRHLQTKHINMPSGLTNSYFFCKENTVLRSVSIEDGLTSIGNSAFYNCRSLSSITIPNSVTIISTEAFQGCRSLTSITIPSGVTSIGYGVFNDCTGLTSVDIPNSVTSIGNQAFSRCSSLTSIIIPSGVTSIGNDVFAYCGSLTSITISSGVTSIGSSDFYECSSLTSVTIPDSVTSIGAYAFYNCSSLTSVTINAVTPPTLGNNVFDNTNNCPIYVPAASVDAYKAASKWGNYEDRIFPIQ